MSLERTLSIVKPDGVRKNVIGDVCSRFEKAGLRIIAARMMCLSRAQAEAFYEVHRERPFFRPLTAFMTSGPCMPKVLERADAVAALRTAIGATDPAQADEGTVRRLFAESKERNAIHASDSDDNAERETRFFFPDTELTSGR